MSCCSTVASAGDKMWACVRTLDGWGGFRNKELESNSPESAFQDCPRVLLLSLLHAKGMRKMLSKISTDEQSQKDLLPLIGLSKRKFMLLLQNLPLHKMAC